jgi:hypothetical protein
VTNYERIKSMTVEEMADHLIFFNICNCCPLVHMCHCSEEDLDCETQYKNWLRAESEIKHGDNCKGQNT